MGIIFGDYIKKLRLDRKLTLRDVEEKVKISNAYLSQVERGERATPTLKILVKLAEVYGVPVSVLSEKAELELRQEKIQGEPGQTGTEQKEEMPNPDIDFICRGYEHLSNEKKRSLKNFLQYLQTEDKDNK